MKVYPNFVDLPSLLERAIMSFNVAIEDWAYRGILAGGVTPILTFRFHPGPRNHTEREFAFLVLH